MNKLLKLWRKLTLYTKYVKYTYPLIDRRWDLFTQIFLVCTVWIGMMNFLEKGMSTLHFMDWFVFIILIGGLIGVLYNAPLVSSYRKNILNFPQQRRHHESEKRKHLLGLLFFVGIIMLCCGSLISSNLVLGKYFSQNLPDHTSDLVVIIGFLMTVFASIKRFSLKQYWSSLQKPQSLYWGFSKQNNIHIYKNWLY